MFWSAGNSRVYILIVTLEKNVFQTFFGYCRIHLTFYITKLVGETELYFIRFETNRGHS